MFLETKNRDIFLKKESALNTALHLHNETEVFICTENTVAVSCNGEERILTPGDLMIAFPYDIHSYSNKNSGNGFLLIFDTNISSELKKYIFSGKYANFASLPEIIPLFENMIPEYFSDHSLTILLGHLHIIMGTLFKKLPPKNNETHFDSDLLTKALIYISENYTSRLTLSSLAKHLGVSLNHLSRVISEKIPAGFCKYLQQIRIYHACELLKNTDKTIYEILLESGFTNLQTFYRVFKKETGQSPKEYRKGM